MTQPPKASHPSRAWEVSFANGELLVWLRWGRASLWIDTASNRWEVGGRSLLAWALPRDPMESFQGLPQRVPESGVDPEMVARVRALGYTHGRSGWLALGILVLVGLWVVLGQAGPSLRAAGCLMVVLGARLRGAAGGAFMILALLVAQRSGYPIWGMGILGISLLAAQSLGWRRIVYPLASAAALAPMDPVFTPVWFVVGAGAGAWELRTRRLPVALGGEEAWRFHCLTAVLAKVQDPEVWSLDHRDPEGMPPSPAYRLTSRWQVDGRTPVMALGDDGQCWVFLPRTLAIIQIGMEVRLHPLTDLVVGGGPCTWESGPPGLGADAWIVSLEAGADHLELLFGARGAGQAFEAELRPWARAPHDLPPQESPSSPRREALALLGLGPGASEADIRRAYHRAVRRVHPDQHPGATPEVKRALEARLRVLNEAMVVLRSGA